MARRKQFNREDVLDRAMRLFWIRGYEATSVQDLVEATGINRASMYDTFGDKRRLFLAAVDRYVTHQSGGMLKRLQEGPSPLAALERHFDAAIAVSTEESKRLGCLLTNSTVELSPRDAEVAERIGGSIARVEDAFFDAVRRAQIAGEIPPEKDARALARFLTATMQGVRVLARGGASEDNLRDVVDVALERMR